MASVSGSRLAFFANGVSDASKINVVLTADGSDVAGKAITGDFNIEVFTTSTGNLASGFQASAFIQDAQQLTNNAVQAGSPTSKETLLDGTGYVLIDMSGGSSRGETITIAGKSGETYSVFGSQGDTITGSNNADVSQYIDATGTNNSKNPGPFTGPETVTGGAGSTTVIGGSGDIITGGAGFMQVNDDRHSGNQTVKGGTGSLKVFNIGPNFSITGSTGGTTYIDDSYGAGGGSSIVGGSGTGLLTDKGLSGENTFIVTDVNDRITVGSALTYINAQKGQVTIKGGDGSITGTVEGAAGYNTNILVGKGSSITLGGAATWIDATAGSTTITAGSGKVHIEAGNADSIIGGKGDLEVDNIGNGDTITGGSGNLFSFGKGTSETITGSISGWTLINSGGSSSIKGGSGTGAGTVLGADGKFDNTVIVGATKDTITGGSATTTYINAFSGLETVTGGSGATTVLAGKGDSIIGGNGTFEVDIDSDTNGKSVTVDLSKGTGAATLRDISTKGGGGGDASVTGFDTKGDAIASKTSVSTTGTFLGTSKSDATGTTLTFLDGTTITLAGVTDITKVKFTQ